MACDTHPICHIILNITAHQVKIPPSQTLFHLVSLTNPSPNYPIWFSYKNVRVTVVDQHPASSSSQRDSSEEPKSQALRQ